MSDLESALEVTAAGVALLVAQGVISTDVFFGAKEVQKYLATRRKFHPLFAEAAATVAGLFEEDPILKKSAPGLRAFSQSSPQQFQRALLGVRKALLHMRNLKHQDVSPGVRSRLGRLFSSLWITMELDGRELEPHDFASHYKNLFERLAKLKTVPAPLRTLFRKLSKLTPRALPQGADPGAWFSMSPVDRVQIVQEVRKEKEVQDRIFEEIQDQGERMAAYRASANRLADLQGKAGVNLSIIEAGDLEPLVDILKREKKLIRNGPTEYVVETFLQDLRDSKKRYPNQNQSLTARELGKFTTLLGKAKTLESAKRVVQEAQMRGILGKGWVEDFAAKSAQASKNKALRDGLPLTPLKFEPKTPEEFQSEHDTGSIRFEGDWTEEEKANVLGRVSTALGQLESVFGKGFCGKHARKLDFVFEDSELGLSRASYFGWDDRNRWQPRVKFGKDYEGLLAHELSHYLDDLVSYQVAKGEGLVPEFQYGDVGHGSGDIFGTTGQTVRWFVERTESLDGDSKLTAHNAAIVKIPELGDIMREVVQTEDYKRWEDKLGQLEMYIDLAIENLTGSHPTPGNPYYEVRMGEARYKSELGPELLEETIRLFTKDAGGDTRKLRYWDSAVEVWARLCEQYVYNKMARSGISNPWLTRMTYDTDVEDAFVDEKTFEERIEPLMEKAFARLRERKIIAKSRYFDIEPGSSMSSDLLAATVRLAYVHPELRAGLLPLIRNAASMKPLRLKLKVGKSLLKLTGMKVVDRVERDSKDMQSHYYVSLWGHVDDIQFNQTFKFSLQSGKWRISLRSGVNDTSPEDARVVAEVTSKVDGALIKAITPMLQG